MTVIMSFLKVSLLNKRTAAVVVALLLSLSASLASAAPLPSPPLLSANSYLLFDHKSGEVLAAKDPDKRIEPASLTKMMTAYIVATELKRGSISLDEPVTVSYTHLTLPTKA